MMGRRRMLVCRISDGTGTLTLRFFNFTAAQKNSLSPGRLMRCFGEVRPGKYGLEMAHPEYKLLGEEQAGQTEEALTPSTRPPRGCASSPCAASPIRRWPSSTSTG